MKSTHSLAAALLGLAAVLTLSLGIAGPGQERLFGTEPNSGNLLEIDPATGLSTIVGPMGIGAVPALGAAAFPDFQLYMGSGSGGADLYRVNADNGAGAFVADSGLGNAAIGALDAAADGTMYASVNIAGDGSTGSDHLATIDLTTGLATVIGPYGTCTPALIPLPADGSGSCTIEGMEGMAFAPDGTLYGSVSARAASGAPGLYTINPATGAATFLAPILDAAGAAPTGGVVSLQFTCDGALYGGTARSIGAADGGFLVRINPATGQFAFVGGTAATNNGASLAGLAFLDGCENVVVPALNQPGLFVLIALLMLVGVAVLARMARRGV